MTQPDLFTHAPLVPGHPHEAQFWAFHRANPHVFTKLVALARQAQAAGVRRIGMRLLWERLRWSALVETARADGEWKLNDWYPPLYSRLLQREHPELASLFETRTRRSDA